MVAYSFQPMFEQQIVDLTKRQTVRSDRKRHARPGEAVQLFCGMRARSCRKLLSPDPICVGVHRIAIGVSVLIDEMITSIWIDGVPLLADQIEAFAKADGFAVSAVGDWRFKQTGHKGSARWNMGDFWMQRHGSGHFEGVLIRWEPQP